MSESTGRDAYNLSRECLETCRDEVNAVLSRTHGTAQRDALRGEILRINGLLLELDKTDLEKLDIAAGKLVEQISAKSKQADREVQKLRDATAALKQFSAVVDKLTGVVKAFAPFATI